MKAILLLGALMLQTSLVTIFDFREVEQIEAWTLVNDSVMGGVSQGNWYQQDDYAVFAGDLSLDNNGGFSSVRIGFRPVDLSVADGLALKVRGDGQTYAFGLRDTNSRYDYRFTFETDVSEDGEWQTVFIPFDGLTATFFGEQIPGAPAFNPAMTRGMNLIISDKQEGAFRLEVAGIALYRKGDEGAAV